jgi:hypothetical protein
MYKSLSFATLRVHPTHAHQLLVAGTYVQKSQFRHTHAHQYWLLGNCVSKTTCSEDLCQALQDYHTHQTWQETEDASRRYRRFHFDN